MSISDESESESVEKVCKLSPFIVSDDDTVTTVAETEDELSEVEDDEETEAVHSTQYPGLLIPTPGGIWRVSYWTQ